jgi:hypothetical protein
MLWFFLLVLVLGLVFGWHVAAVLLVLWLIGYVGSIMLAARDQNTDRSADQAS